jgi:hypothetical protein
MLVALLIAVTSGGALRFAAEGRGRPGLPGLPLFSNVSSVLS